jgi:hypothetical protein
MVYWSRQLSLRVRTNAPVYSDIALVAHRAPPMAAFNQLKHLAKIAA